MENKKSILSNKGKNTKSRTVPPEEKRRRAVIRAAQKALVRLEGLIDDEDTPKNVLMSAINEALKLASKQNEECEDDGAFEGLLIRVVGDDGD